MRSLRPNMSALGIGSPSARTRAALIVTTTAAAGLIALIGAPAAGAATAPMTAGRAQHAPSLVSSGDQARISHWAGTLHQIRTCESSGNYHISTGNGYYGAYQFAAATWHNLGYHGLPNQAASVVQDAAAAKLLTRSGTSSWGACA